MSNTLIFSLASSNHAQAINVIQLYIFKTIPKVIYEKSLHMPYLITYKAC